MKKTIIFTLIYVFIMSIVPYHSHAKAVQVVTDDPEVGLQRIKIEKLKPIKKKHFKAVKKLVQVQVQSSPTPTQTSNQSASVRSAGGCVTGYTSSNYALNQIMQHESSGNSCATNAGDCFGLLQACPGAPLRAACGGNPTCQIDWFIKNKTGGRSWETIWALWQTQGWW